MISRRHDDELTPRLAVADDWLKKLPTPWGPLPGPFVLPSTAPSRG